MIAFSILTLLSPVVIPQLMIAFASVDEPAPAPAGGGGDTVYSSALDTISGMFGRLKPRKKR